MPLRKTSFIVLAFGVLGIGLALLLNTYFVATPEDLALKAGMHLERKAKIAESALNDLSDFSKQKKSSGTFETYFLKEHLGLYVFENNKLLYWNNAKIPVDTNLLQLKQNFGLVKLEVGYFLYLKQIKNYKTLVALCAIKPTYPLQNNYLNNHFLEYTGLPNGLQLQNDTSSGAKVKLNGRALFALKGTENFYYNSFIDHLCFGFFIVGISLLLLVITIHLRQGLSHVNFGFYVIGLLGVRGVMLVFHWPAFFYRTVFYDVHVFGNAASALNSYLGDIVLNALCLLFISVWLNIHLHSGKQKFSYYLSILLPGFLTGLTYFQLNRSLVSLVNNSTLNFDFLNIFSLGMPEISALSALALYSLSLYILLATLIKVLQGHNYRFLIFMLLLLLICALHLLPDGAVLSWQQCWLILFGFCLYGVTQRFQLFGTMALGLQITFMSLVCSAFITSYLSKNQKQDLELLALKLSEKQDAILENEFIGIPEKIRKDESLKILMSLLPGSEKEVEQKLRQAFFTGYFDRYEVNLALFDKDCHPLLSSKQAVLKDAGYFEERLKLHSDSVSKDLYFVKDYLKNAQYLSKISIDDKCLYLLLEPKQFEELGSFPDLLLDRSLQKQEQLKNLSWAVYRGQKSVNRYGDCNYPNLFLDSISLSKTASGYLHYYFKIDETSLIIISQAKTSWFYYFTFNSYLLLFFSTFTYLSYLLYSGFISSQWQRSSLTRRIQTIIILLLFLAMSAVGLTSGYLVSRQFRFDNQKELAEKTEVILSELTTQFKPELLFYENQKEPLNLKLREYSRLFNTPISLFDASGKLFTTSENKLYELGLAAKWLNPHAFEWLGNNKASSVNVREVAGTLEYMSYYTPLYSSSEQIIGYINLPYFARQGDLAKELSGIIGALINVYVILLVLSIVAGLILSGYITSPLRIIKQQIAKIGLGKLNEKIQWQSNDEIGKLVSEYNQMLVKLEESANLLAQSERESAWREMAKQVAHEIKNPLTPMKLNLQYLQHVMKTNPEDFKERFEKASAGIIEQIDSLASIANEFSNFAKLPEAQLQVIDLNEIINSAIVFAGNSNNIKVTNHLGNTAILVKGDKDQCLRVFNNILKNAVQALDECNHPEIEIACEKTEKTVVISVRDNGCGIDEMLKPKLFTPNFTTKNSGSGLGLAMAKNSMLAFGGNIWFESEIGLGSTFYLEFLEDN